MRDDLAAPVAPARPADAAGPLPPIAPRALVDARRRDLVRRAPLARARVRLLFLWDVHRASQSSGGRSGSAVELELRELRPARVGSRLVRVAGLGVVEVLAAHRAQAL